MVRPHDPAELDRALLEKRRLHLRTNQADVFARLLPWSLINAQVTLTGLHNGRLRLVRVGQDLPYETVVGRSKAGVLALKAAALQEQINQGLSLALNHLHHVSPRIAALVAVVERRYRVRGGANAYVSFQRDGALGPHWDNHDVIILQISGEKRWHCHGARAVHPLVSRSYPTVAEAGPMEWEDTLRPGDLLYIPRGDIHWAAVAEGGHSVHLTINLGGLRARDMLRALAGRLEGDEAAFREEVMAVADGAATRRQLSAQADLLRGALEQPDVAALFTQLDGEREAFQPMNLGLDHTLSDTTEIHPAARGPGPVPSKLPPDQRRVLTQLLATDGARLGELKPALADMEGGAVAQAVAGLARVGQVWLFDD
ncbi:JmjC domain-containing protein [Nitrospirillum sp. BR 11163]|uniref:JmjC domain-containing protein n=1 Tax=Nitrospirillum sp. BR 11163 TaxID=3104323 RepID=UPI002AFF3A00|nr:cupin domain-containing protein [Nitrospirillum sp. BR 11163]MEA1674515.1 cupin domain-containing protein [Nitrospirillum sp. BR 11163]